MVDGLLGVRFKGLSTAARECRDDVDFGRSTRPPRPDSPTPFYHLPTVENALWRHGKATLWQTSHAASMRRSEAL